jgi:hypothetical protein
MATKLKLSSSFRNEILGLWYDTKSQITENFNEIKENMLILQN